MTLLLINNRGVQLPIAAVSIYYHWFQLSNPIIHGWLDDQLGDVSPRVELNEEANGVGYERIT